MVKVGIFILATGRKAGGPETYEVELIRGLARIDTQTEYFIYCTSVDAEKAIGVHQPNITYRVLRPAARAISVAITLPRWMASDGLDFFHSTYAPPPLPNKPFLFTMHCASNFEHPEFYPTFIRWRLNGLQRVALRRAGFFLCVSNFVARYLREKIHLPAERLAITYHGVGAEYSLACRRDAWRMVAQLGIHDPFLLHVGKVQARKNIVGLIHAYARFSKETRSQAKLVLAGKKVETSEGVDEAIMALGLQKAVVQLGYVSQSLLPYLYGAAEMLVFPSFYEGFGIPLLEAMACGCPVVASNVTSLPEAAGDAALLVDPNSTEQIAAAMAEIDGNPQKRNELIERGLKRAPLFTWENCARETLEAYRRFHQELSRTGS
jgi:glycosyltransferase involved in cell wall biosynthesis